MMITTRLLRVVLLLRTLSLEQMVTTLNCPGFIIDSNCGDNQASEWNSKNIGLNLKEWIKSVNVASSINDLEKIHSPIRYNILKSPNDTTLLHLSSSNCETNQNIGPIWQIAGQRGELGSNGFDDGFFYIMPDNKDQVAWIYPDMETVLFGTFKNGTMVSTKESKIVQERCNLGTKELRIDTPNNDSPTFHYKARSMTEIGDQPTLMDSYERKKIYIDFGIKDDGMFARKDIEKDDLIAYYAGLLIDSSNLNGPICSLNLTKEERWDCNRNIINMPSKYRQVINIPRNYWSITKYRATLGHKANHSFRYANSKYGVAYHPRFGMIRAIFATRHITKGEEILVNYQYPKYSNVPKWYSDLYEAELGLKWFANYCQVQNVSS